MIKFKDIIRIHNDLFPEDIIVDDILLRERWRETIGSCGLDEQLFKTRNRFQFPNESAEFICTVLHDYTQRYMKALRRGPAKTLEIPDEKAEWLYKGFSAFVKGFRFDEKVTKQQLHKMDVRLLYSYRKSLRSFESIISDIKGFAHDVLARYQGSHLFYEDLFLFTDYMTGRLTTLYDNMDTIYGKIEDYRSDEMYEGCGNTDAMTNRGIIRNDIESGLVYDKLKSNEEYKKAVKKFEIILKEMSEGEYFVAHYKKEFESTKKKINQIRLQAEVEALGHELTDAELAVEKSFSHPVDVLCYAIEQAANDKIDYLEILKRRPLISEYMHKGIDSNLLDLMESKVGKPDSPSEGKK